MSDLMTVDELMGYLRIGKNKAYNLLKNPSFPKVKIGREYRVKREWVDEWLESQRENSGV